MKSRGGETGGLSIDDALREFESEGYTTQFAARVGGEIICFACRETLPASRFRLVAARRIEGASDPADECVVCALECPACEAHGTAAFTYGPLAAAEDAEAFQRLDDARARAVDETHADGPHEAHKPAR